MKNLVCLKCGTTLDDLECVEVYFEKDNLIEGHNGICEKCKILYWWEEVYVLNNIRNLGIIYENDKESEES